MAKVFVPNEPLGLNDADEWVRIVNLTPAREFGELVFLTPAGRLPEDPSPSVGGIAAKLAGMTTADYILFVGDPRAFGWACAIAAQHLGGLLRLLMWNGRTRRYEPCETNVFAPTIHALHQMEKLVAE